MYEMRNIVFFLRVSESILKGFAIWKTKSYKSFLVGLFCFIFHFERDSESRGGAERGGERERIPSRLHTVSEEPNAGLELTNKP